MPFLFENLIGTYVLRRGFTTITTIWILILLLTLNLILSLVFLGLVRLIRIVVGSIERRLDPLIELLEIGSLMWLSESGNVGLYQLIVGIVHAFELFLMNSQGSENLIK